MSRTYTTNKTTGNTIPINGATVGYQTSSQLYNSGTSGQFLTSGVGTSTNAIWTTGTNSMPNSEVIRINQTKPATIEVKGTMVINGVDLEERLNTIEKVLQIPERDVILERKHPKLQKLYNDYINALGKYRTFEAIKGDE